ncbi:transglutaminase family protein [Legionella impletisoli]|uniref:Transglutaminase n=1 Tax=Legionella impletisoli TaxID=343510 RepID=A0A917JQB8_9GAMM|nr:DUF3488 and transglutaminase-like domain-containing protein [Legionella impletisoli]GGI81606.1 transglutaminase [Legionella impletisoli]
MYVYYGEQIPLATLRHALFVMGFCYLPHFATTPWWLSLFALAAISYRLAGSYWHYPVPPLWMRICIAMSALLILRWHYGGFLSSGFFIGVLVTFFWLKLIELHRKRDLRAIILISFYVIFTALITHTNLWIFFYVIIAVLANLSLLLKMQLPSAPLVRLSRKSLILLVTAIPVSILMFFVFPRIATPMWLINLPPMGQTAFHENMNPGSIASLQTDDRTAMRITFNDQDKAGVTIYWNGLALSHYDGITWSEPNKKAFVYLPLELLSTKEEADYEILLEAHEKRWLFYMEEPIAGWPKLKYSSNTGLTLLDFKPINQRFAYAVTSRPRLYYPLNRLLLEQNLQLPRNSSPKLKDWAAQQMILANHNPLQLTQQILKYIKEKPFWYTLQPKPIGQDTYQLDRFWFDTREGYCEHYSSALAFIYRAAGIPARVILGYYGGEWNPVGKYLNVRQKDAHAWVEYWQNNIGWIRVDPTAAIPPHRIDPTIIEEQEPNQAFYMDWERYQLELPWLSRMKIMYESFKFFWERWLLFYNQERQQELIQSFGFGPWNLGFLIQIWISIVLVFLFFGWAWFHWQSKRIDPLIREYQRLRQEFKRLGIPIALPMSLLAQLDILQKTYPKLDPIVSEFIANYEVKRLKKALGKDTYARKETQILLKDLRKQLRRI